MFTCCVDCGRCHYSSSMWFGGELGWTGFGWTLDEVTRGQFPGVSSNFVCHHPPPMYVGEAANYLLFCNTFFPNSLVLKCFPTDSLPGTYLQISVGSCFLHQLPSCFVTPSFRLPSLSSSVVSSAGCYYAHAFESLLSVCFLDQLVRWKALELQLWAHTNTVHCCHIACVEGCLCVCVYTVGLLGLGERVALPPCPTLKPVPVYCQQFTGAHV